MKKLEDLPKRAEYKVPDGYFDDLPTRIQSRINAGGKTSRRFNLGFSLKYALPLIALLFIGILWYQKSNDSLYDQLNDIDEAQLAWYVDDHEMTSDELVEDVNWTEEDLDALEDEVYRAIDASDEGMDVVIDELDLENF